MYYFRLRKGLDPKNLVGSFVTNTNPHYSKECATGAQFETGTVIAGVVHDAPRTATWLQGAPVDLNTPVGTMVARGWIDGKYPNLPESAFTSGDIINHVGIYIGPGPSPGSILVLDQMPDEGGSLSIRPYQQSKGNWSIVISSQQYDRQPSTSALTTKPVQ